MIVIKEEFVGGEKWRRAIKLGRSDAITMWLALKCYASQHPTSEGFVPDEDIDELPGAPRSGRKALKALVECGRLMPTGQRSSGLVDQVEGGWLLHDYLDHSATPEELELRREKARLKKQRQREDKRRELEQLRSESGIASPFGLLPIMRLSPGQMGDTGGHVPGDTPGDTPRHVPGESLAGVRPPAPTRTRVPNPTQPNPTHESDLRARAHEGSPGVARTYTMPCQEPPKDYLEQAIIESTPLAQAKSTWKWYWGAGLPATGVERLYSWLLQQAREKVTRESRPLPRPGPSRQQDDPGTRGHEAVVPQSEHRHFAAKHGLDLKDIVARFNRDPRVKGLSTIEAWDALTRVLESAAGRNQQLGGAA